MISREHQGRLLMADIADKYIQYLQYCEEKNTMPRMYGRDSFTRYLETEQHVMYMDGELDLKANHA